MSTFGGDGDGDGDGQEGSGGGSGRWRSPRCAEFGGPLIDPARVLTNILASLHDSDTGQLKVWTYRHVGWGRVEKPLFLVRKLRQETMSFSLVFSKVLGKGGCMSGLLFQSAKNISPARGAVADKHTARGHSSGKKVLSGWFLCI